MGLRAITHKHFLICEGMHDVECFDYLRKGRGLPAFQATSAGFIAGAPSGRDGIDYLTPALDALASVAGFAQLEKILIVADNDGNPQGALQRVQQKINATAVFQQNRRYVAPAQEQVTAGANPSITILMLPWSGQAGALDTLSLTAARNKEPTIAACVDAFAICVNTAGWTAPREDKMKLRALISAAYNDPYISPAWVWRDGTNLVPLNDPVFDQVETFLRTFLV
jgi:hypothetical protein